MRRESPMAPYGELKPSGKDKAAEINERLLDNMISRFVAGNEYPEIKDKQALGKAIDLMKAMIQRLEANNDLNGLEHAQANLNGLQNAWFKILELEEARKLYK